MKKLIFIFFFLTMSASSANNFPCDYMKYSNIDKAQKITKGKGSVIAIIDWMFDINDEVLKPFYLNPKSFTENNFSNKMKPWHGQWMTQLAHSVAPEAQIIIIEAVQDCSKKSDKLTCWKDNVNKALKYAADNGAVAVSISHRMIKDYKARTDAINYANQKGTIFVDINYSGINDNVLIPGSDGSADVHVCKYSPFGYKELKAVLPATWNGEGLSNTAPIVTGVIALIKSVNPKLTGMDIKKIIIDTAKSVNGKKVVDALAAVVKAKQIIDVKKYRCW